MHTRKYKRSKYNKHIRRTKKVGGGNLEKKLKALAASCEKKRKNATTPLKKTELSNELRRKIEILTNCKSQLDHIPEFENLQPPPESLRGFPPIKASSNPKGFSKSASNMSFDDDESF